MTMKKLMVMMVLVGCSNNAVPTQKNVGVYNDTTRGVVCYILNYDGNSSISCVRVRAQKVGDHGE